MKIALPTQGKVISGHFGHCVCFKVFDVDNKVITGQSTIENDEEHQPGVLPKLLKSHGVNVVIADGIGQKAIEIFNSLDIKVISGVTGLAENAVNQFINDTLESGNNGCSH